MTDNVSNAFSFGDVSVEPLHVGIVLAALSAFIVIVILGGTAVKALDAYRTKRREDRAMTFKASDIGIKDVECWR